MAYQQRRCWWACKPSVTFIPGVPTNEVIAKHAVQRPRPHLQQEASSARAIAFFEVPPHDRLLLGSRRPHPSLSVHHNEAHRDVKPVQSIF